MAGGGGAAPDAFKLLDAIPWTLTFAGIVASLIWNYFNYRRTTGLQRTIRQETVRLEEFRRIRTPIDATLTELRNERATLNTLATSGHALAELREEIAKVEQAIVKIYVRLQTALDDANTSAYASGDDWVQAVEPSWEAFINAIDGVHNPNRTDTEVRTAIVSAVSKLEQLGRAVGARIDRELQRYTGDTTPVT